MIAPDKLISYGTVRETFRRDLESIGDDPTKFGLHSLRSGGATMRSGGATMAANNGVNDRVLLEVGASQIHIC